MTNNPWTRRAIVGFMSLAAAGLLTAIGLLVAILVGWMPSPPPLRVFAAVMLAFIFGMSFIIAMSERWDAKHSDTPRKRAAGS